MSKLHDLIDQAAAMTQPGEQFTLGLTGGEAFLDVDRLVEILRYAVARGASTSCVTNAFWASNDAKAAAIVAQVRDAGLETVSCSTSTYHQQYVPIQRVRRATDAFRAVGIPVLLKVAYTASDLEEGNVERWHQAIGADQLQSFAVVPYLREGASLPDSEYARSEGIPEGRCPAPGLSIRETGDAYCCCTPGGFEPLLRVGRVDESPLTVLDDRFRFDPVLTLLRHHGPAHIAQYAQRHGAGHRLRSSYADVCDLCAHIASDAVLTDFARADARAVRREWASCVVSGLRRQPVSDVPFAATTTGVML